MLTDQQLEILIDSGEQDRVEFKRSGSDTSAISRTICAFANDLPENRQPGVIFVGLEDDGSCAGLDINDRLLRGLANMRDGNILPTPTLTISQKFVRKCNVAVIVISPSSTPPVRYQGRTWIRIGPTTRQATPEEERRLAERRRAAELPYDHQAVPDAKIDDIHLEFFRSEYLPSAIQSVVLMENDRSIEEQLISLRLMTPDRLPNYGALLILGRDPIRWIPGAYVQFVRFDGLKITDPVRDEKRLFGALIDVLPKLDEILEINISTSVDPVTGPREIRQPDYPVVALQQLVRNALMHRVYEGTNAPTRIHWFVDRIEISNPGGLFGQVNEQNFGRGATDYRNPLIAEAMKVLGYVQRFGMGIPLARTELEKNGNPAPEFNFRTENILATIRAAG